MVCTGFFKKIFFLILVESEKKKYLLFNVLHTSNYTNILTRFRNRGLWNQRLCISPWKLSKNKHTPIHYIQVKINIHVIFRCCVEISGTKSRVIRNTIHYVHKFSILLHHVRKKSNTFALFFSSWFLSSTDNPINACSTSKTTFLFCKTITITMPALVPISQSHFTPVPTCCSQV